MGNKEKRTVAGWTHELAKLLKVRPELLDDESSLMIWVQSIWQDGYSEGMGVKK